MRISRCISCLFIVLIASGSACKRTSDSGSSNHGGSKPNLLVITVDTTRADRLGCYGHAAAQTPTMDRLAAEGVRFDNAYTVAPMTLPSHASLLTGRVPQATGLRINSAGPGGGMLSPDIPTVATLLKKQGYQTAAFVSAMVLAEHFGLNNGFDVYDDKIVHAEHKGESDDPHLERPANKTCDAALAWLAQPRDGAYFLWVHLFDPHLPFEPPPPFNQTLADPYDGEIAFMDSQIGRLMSALEQRGERSRTLVVLAGDHGESLGEHGEKDHRLFVYNATMHVPLIFSFADRIPRGDRVDAPVGLVDVFPTILGLFELPVPAGVNGRDLAGSWKSDTWESRPVYAESEYARWSFGWAPLYTLITPRWKYIEAPRPELYDLAADPREIANIAGENPGMVRDMSGVLRSLMASYEHQTAPPVQDADRALQQLSGLGYVGSSTSMTPSPLHAGAFDPKDMLAVYHEIMSARVKLQRADHAGVVAVLEPLLGRPQSDIGLSDHAYDETLANLAEAYFKLEQYDRALDAYRRSLRSAPEDPARLTAVALSLDRLGQPAAAVETFEKTLAVSPDWVPAHRELAGVYTRQRNLPKALPHWMRVTELAPQSAPDLTNLGSTLLALGKPAEAVGPLLRALAQEPDNEFIYRSLWQALVATGKRKEAIALLRDAQRRFPNKQPFVCPLARLLAVTPGLGAADRTEGLQLAQVCAGTAPDSAEMLVPLALAFAANGDFAKAIGTAEVARRRFEAANKPDELRRIDGYLEAFRAGRAVNE